MTRGVFAGEAAVRTPVLGLLASRFFLFPIGCLCDKIHIYGNIVIICIYH
jgi:hypothetical protein